MTGGNEEPSLAWTRRKEGRRVDAQGTLSRWWRGGIKWRINRAGFEGIVRLDMARTCILPVNEPEDVWTDLRLHAPLLLLLLFHRLEQVINLIPLFPLSIPVHSGVALLGRCRVRTRSWDSPATCHTDLLLPPLVRSSLQQVQVELSVQEAAKLRGCKSVCIRDETARDFLLHCQCDTFASGSDAPS